MKITDVRTTTFTYPTGGTVDIVGHGRAGPVQDKYQTLLTIETDEGVAGYAFGATPNLIEHAVKPVLLGHDPFDRELLWQRLVLLQRYHKDLHDQELGVIDLALWDLLGRAVDKPVWKLLGGYRDKVLAYASTPCGGGPGERLSTPDEYAQLARQCVARGFKAIKLHSWMPPVPSWEHNPKRDIEACEAVRDAVGPDVPLMLDCWHYFSREEALYLGRELERLDFHWIEEPLDEFSMSSYIWLADQLDIAVLGPEHLPGHHKSRAEWVVRGACDILRASIMHCGGITAMMKIVHMAESFDVSVELHGGGTASLHVLGAMAIPGEYLELGANPSSEKSFPPYLQDDPAHMDDDGYVHMPTRPGIGETIDFDYINSRAIEPPADLRLQRQR